MLEPPAPPADLRGKIVLVGATAIGLPDTNFAVPDMRGGPMAGVEVDAHALENALAGGFFRRPSELALGLWLLALGGLVGSLLGPSTTFVASGLACLLVVAALAVRVLPLRRTPPVAAPEQTRADLVDGTPVERVEPGAAPTLSA